MEYTERTKWLNRECPDGGMLQSEEWRMVGDCEGIRTVHFENHDFWANVFEYQLPMVGRYWYVPRGPIFGGVSDSRLVTTSEGEWQVLINRAKQESVRWIRTDPKDQEVLSTLGRLSAPCRVFKAPHDVQPREIFVLDISRDECAILSQMKPKTRYNIGLAERHGVAVSMSRSESLDEFFRLVKETARRNDIVAHPLSHYRAMVQSFPPGALELFAAKREGKVLAVILVAFFGDTATYLHGASSDDGREHMAPFLVQWEAMLEAKRRGISRYDLGGIDTLGLRPGLQGVTRFKTGFAKNVNGIVFPGSFDILLSQSHYFAYRAFSLSKNIVKNSIGTLTKI